MSAKYVGKVQLLPEASPETPVIAERLLVDVSRHDYPTAVARLGEALLARLDPDGPAPSDAELDRAGGFSPLTKPDGSALPRGCLTPEATAGLAGADFHALAAPVPDAAGLAWDGPTDLDNLCLVCPATTATSNDSAGTS